MDRRRLRLIPAALAVPFLVWGMVRLSSPGARPAAAPRPSPSLTPPDAAAEPRFPAGTPADVAALVRQGRSWAAARRLREVVKGDTSPEMVLFAARTEGAWGGWSNVPPLLQGKAWLDRVEGGEGWYLLARAREEARDLPGAADAYSRSLRAAADTALPWRTVAELRDGLVLLRAGRTDEGVATLERLRAHAPAASGWASVLAAEALVPRGDTASVRALVGGGLAESPVRSQHARIGAALAARDPAGAHALALAFRARAGDPALRADLGVQAARASLALGDAAAALGELRQALADGSSSPAGADAARLILTVPGVAPEDRLAAALAFDRNHQPSPAADQYRAWLSSAQASPDQRRDVAMRLGRALFAAGRWGEAASALASLDGLAPPAAAEAGYLAGRAQYHTAGRAAATRTLLETARRYPGQPSSADALFLAGDLADDAGDRAGAQALYRRVAADFGTAPAAGQALMRLGGAALLAGDWSGAASWFGAYGQRFPSGDLWLQATYWEGRALAARGDAAGARQRWEAVRRKEPLSYYTVLSARRLEVSYWPLALAPAPRDVPAAVERVRGWMATVDVLREADLWREAEEEVTRRVAEAGTDRALLYPLAEALEERGLAPQGIRIGIGLRESSPQVDERLARILYPFPYREMIAAEARERGLDPFLAAAVIRQESSFKPRAQSRVGALGLMQVMPGTASGLASGEGIRGWSADLLFTPEINVHLGTRFLAAEMQHYGGDLPLVFIAYNAGPARADRWRSFPEFRDRELFVERIPFAETRDYVKILTRNTAIYRALYGG